MTTDAKILGFFVSIAVSVALFLFVTSVISVLLGFTPDYWSQLKRKVANFFAFLFDPNYGRGPTNGTGWQYESPPMLPHNLADKTADIHLHKWEFLDTVKHNWRIERGIALGEIHDIDKIIQVIREKPGHTETKLDEVLRWKAQGYEVVHISWHRWKCRLCGEIHPTEFYNAPGRKIINLPCNLNDDRFKKTTTHITTFYREVPVEAVKKYK